MNDVQQPIILSSCDEMLPQPSTCYDDAEGVYESVKYYAAALWYVGSITLIIRRIARRLKWRNTLSG